MDIYKYEQRRKKRGLQCLVNHGTYGYLCGCGSREKPSKKHKNRIVKRALDADLKRIIKEI